MKLPNGLSNIMKKGDTFILDRGFRDVVPFLEERGFTVLMPALKSHRNQLTAQESNQSRVVTKLRWVVEADHGMIAHKCKFLHNQLCNNLLPNKHIFCKITCFLLNLFSKRLENDDEKVDGIIERINSRQTEENSLAIEVETNNWNRKSKPFATLSSDVLLDFSEMTVSDMEIFFTGKY